MPVAWTDAADFAAYDLVLPLIAWGYHQHFASWQALLDRFEREAVRVAQSGAGCCAGTATNPISPSFGEGRRDRSVPRVRSH